MSYSDICAPSPTAEHEWEKSRIKSVTYVKISYKDVYICRYCEEQREKVEMAMTPIKCIMRSGVMVFTVDYNDEATLVCVGASQEQAEWTAWSLGRAHSVPNNLGEGMLTMKARPIDL